MMLTVWDGLPSYVRMYSLTPRSPLPMTRRTAKRFLLGCLARVTLCCVDRGFARLTVGIRAPHPRDRWRAPLQNRWHRTRPNADPVPRVSLDLSYRPRAPSMDDTPPIRPLRHRIRTVQVLSAAVGLRLTEPPAERGI